MEHDKIYELFEPIFQWLNENFPNGAYFLVDKYSAKLYSNENITVFSKEIKDYTQNLLDNKIEVKEKASKPLFILNIDTLKK